MEPKFNGENVSGFVSLAAVTFMGLKRPVKV